MNEFVAAGAALLDERKPGWHSEINLDTLSLTSSMECILGQLYGDYHNGLFILDVDGASYGFVCNEYRNCGCASLKEDWIEQINKRVNKSA